MKEWMHSLFQETENNLYYSQRMLGYNQEDNNSRNKSPFADEFEVRQGKGKNGTGYMRIAVEHFIPARAFIYI